MPLLLYDKCSGWEMQFWLEPYSFMARRGIRFSLRGNRRRRIAVNFDRGRSFKKMLLSFSSIVFRARSGGGRRSEDAHSGERWRCRLQETCSFTGGIERVILEGG